MSASKLQKLIDKIYGKNERTVKYSYFRKEYFVTGNNMPTTYIGEYEKAKEYLETILQHKNNTQ